MRTVTELEQENAGLRKQLAELKRQLVKAFEAMKAEHDRKQNSETTKDPL